jgi:hypothetical protein
MTYIILIYMVRIESGVSEYEDALDNPSDDYRSYPGE